MANFGKITSKQLNFVKNKIIPSFEGTPVAYSDDSALGKLLQRITDRIADLTPDIAPNIAFVQATEYIKPSIAFEGFFRRFEVLIANQSPGSFARNSGASPFTCAIYIEIGYPDGPTTLYENESIYIPAIKASDLRQIDALMQGGDLTTSPTDLGIAIAVVKLQGSYDMGNTLRRLNYTIEVQEVYP